MATTDSGEQWLSISEASRALGMSRTTLLGAEEAGLITPARTPGGHRRYHLTEVRRYLGRVGAGQPPEPAPTPPPTSGTCRVESAHLAAAVREAVRPLVQALGADNAGVYLVQDDALRFCAGFGIPRWLAERLSDAAPPPLVVRALETRRHRLFDPAAVAFPEPRATGHGLAVALRRDDRALGVLFLVTPPSREPHLGEMRVIDAFRELMSIVVEGQRRIADLEHRLVQIAAISGQ
ncbi:MAG: MerR family DNA-binding transcriptional regulator [Thermocrispum sp.]